MPQSPMPAPSPEARPPQTAVAPAGIQALRGLACLLVLQAAGELVSRALALPVPGPVVGLLLLLVALRLPALREPVAAAAQALLAHLSLLFVPVGVGVVAHLGLVGAHGPRLLVVIVLSTWIGMVVTALLARAWLVPPDRDRSAR